MKIEMNSLAASVSYTDANIDTSTRIMELTVENMKPVISNGTDPVLFTQTIKILSEFTCQVISQLPMSFIS